MRKIAIPHAWERIAARLPFECHGAMSGADHNGCKGSWGRLPDAWKDALNSEAHAVDYIVHSYGTPIAWHNRVDDTWTVPDVKYSVTTSRHQGVVRRALG